MPRLARKNIKVFAGSATNNGVFGSLQANNPTITSDVEQIQSLTAWGEGWNAATETSEELPPLEEIQGVEYVTTYQQAYIMQEGVPEWSATVTYYKGCLTKEVTSTGFRIYNSLTDNNIGNLLSDTSNWKKVMDSDDLYAFDGTVVHDTGNESVAGVKTFSSSPLVPTPSNSDNSQKTANTAFVMGAINTVENSLQTQIDTKATPSDIENAITGYYPKYNQAVNRASGTTYTASKNCRVIIVGSIYNNGDRNSMQSIVQIDGVNKFVLYGGYVYGYNEDPFFVSFDLKAGQTYRIFSDWGGLTIRHYQEIPF